MKLITMLFFIHLIVPVISSAQINCENCKQKEYPYIGCKGGEKIHTLQ
jgi:hypothetical protein